MALKEDILNIIGLDTTNDYLDSSSIADIYPIMSDAVYRTVCILPKKLLLINAQVSMDVENLADDITNPSNDPLDVDTVPDDGHVLSQDELILCVERTLSTSKDSVNGWQEIYLTRHAKEVLYTQRHRALDSESIHFATDYSPVYWVEKSTSNNVRIYTAPQSAAALHNVGVLNYLDTNASAIRVWSYPKQDITSSDTTFTHTPPFLKEFLLKICAIALINTKIAAQATEEEDSELMQLLGNVKSVFEEDCKTQLLNYKEKY